MEYEKRLFLFNTDEAVSRLSVPLAFHSPYGESITEFVLSEILAVLTGVGVAAWCTLVVRQYLIQELYVLRRQLQCLYLRQFVARQ